MKAFRNLGLALAVAGVVVLAVGCPPPEAKCKIMGWVMDDSDTPLPFVQVAVGEKRAHTDGSGLFSIDSVPAGKSVTVVFSLKGYASTSQSITPKASTENTVNVVMKQLATGTHVADASAGGSFSAGGASLTVPAGAIDTASAKSAGATVHITAVNLAEDAGAANLPAGLSATVGAQTGLLDVQALVNITFEVDGISADFTAGSSGSIRMKLSAGSSFHAGDTVELWYFDLRAGAWVQSGTAMVVQSGGHLYVEGTIAHCGWWCCAWSETDLYTITGHVYDAENQPVGNALVAARGLDYHGTTWTASDENGAYAIRALPDAQVRLNLILPGAYYVCDTLTVSTGAAGEVLENQDLAPDFKSCVQGNVTEEDGATPVEGAHVYSSTGGSAVTAPDGYFCMLAPGSTTVAVYVLGGPPVFTRTPATATCEAGNGADVTLSVRYPKDGDRLGFVFGSLRNVTIPFVGNRTYLSTSALFYSGFKGEQFAPYDPDSPLDGYSVYTAQPSVSFDWGAIGLQLAFDLDFDVNETFNLNDGEVPSITKIGALDAGSPAVVTNGAASFNLLRPLDFFYPFEGNGSLQDLGYALLEPWMGGFFFQQGLWSDDFLAGDTVTFTWPGGIDMGAFTATTVLPGALNLTAPTDLSDAFSDDALEDGLIVTWDAEGQGSYVTLILESIVSEGLFGGAVSVGAVVCKAADDGEYTIPAEVLAQLPIMSSGGTQINYLFAKRHTITKVDVPLTVTDGTGYVVVTVDSAPVKMWSLDWRVVK